MSIPMTPAEVAQTSDDDLVPGNCNYGDLYYLVPGLGPDNPLQGQAAGNMG